MRPQPLAGDCPVANLDRTAGFAHPGGQILLGSVAAPSAPGPRTDDYVFGVGPEGGFSDEEVAAAQAAGWHSIDLGPRILRVETAAILLAASVMLRSE